MYGRLVDSETLVYMYATGFKHTFIIYRCTAILLSPFGLTSLLMAVCQHYNNNRNSMNNWIWRLYIDTRTYTIHFCECIALHTQCPPVHISLNKKSPDDSVCFTGRFDLLVLQLQYNKQKQTVRCMMVQDALFNLLCSNIQDLQTAYLLVPCKQLYLHVHTLHTS